MRQSVPVRSDCQLIHLRPSLCFSDQNQGRVRSLSHPRVRLSHPRLDVPRARARNGKRSKTGQRLEIEPVVQAIGVPFLPALPAAGLTIAARTIYSRSSLRVTDLTQIHRDIHLDHSRTTACRVCCLIELTGFMNVWVKLRTPTARLGSPASTCTSLHRRRLFFRPI